MKIILSLRLLLFALLSSLVISGCGTLEPTERPAEYTPPPAHTALWEAIDSAVPGDWHVLLNDGPTALDWRLRAIDSASQRIDLQTFLWQLGRVLVPLDGADPARPGVPRSGVPTTCTV